MRRLVVFLILAGLFLGQGFSVAAAVCQHRSAHDHAMALHSHDGAVAEAAQAEETAASVVEKKGALAGSSLALEAAVLAPAPSLAPPGGSHQAVPWPMNNRPELGRSDPAPLLRPPLV